MSKEELKVPKFDYYLDESDPDIVILRRQDGTFVAAFSAQGATKKGIVEAAKEDDGQLVAAYAAKQGQSSAHSCLYFLGYVTGCPQLNFREHPFHEGLSPSPTPRPPPVHRHPAQRGCAAQPVL
ncbi:MAG: hypothetical protein M3317_09200 [Actinomycetota bacterium]|nr:hypothetical protein [Actinomycetota bacterium]